jgi:hypothetical protein
MQGYQSLTSAVADSYSDAGHSFYMLNFDADGVTHCLDTSTGLWHERGTWIPEENRYVSWRPRFYAYAFGEHRMLDSSNGNLYRVSTDLYADVDGRMIRRMRRAPAISNENRRVFYSEFELDIEPGTGRDLGQVSFSMEVFPSVVQGTVTDGANPVPDADVVLEIDGEVFGTTTTDANGEYLFANVPDGTAIVGVSDGAQCGTGTDTIVYPGPTTINITTAACDPFTADFTAVTDGPFEAGGGTLTLTPTVSGGSGVYIYDYRIWSEYGGTVSIPYDSSSEPAPVFSPLYDVGPANGICSGEAILFIVDAATLEELEIGPKPWDWFCI